MSGWLDSTTPTDRAAPGVLARTAGGAELKGSVGLPFQRPIPSAVGITYELSFASFGSFSLPVTA
ncbi:unnamed protein product [Chondrus crispus]|uniref:Uncharacterized protein n=1 Tax=Chondrus crispus TaxID=2769 RepID=R7QSG3_CHOCR|nr:unnamed protein product [Chondrus crispus]CDF40683.1 unnamed protein product [Chondrus crispus]|eukprot:XP_005710977.1 unnamed protein product [Chondrus crispus]